MPHTPKGQGATQYEKLLPTLQLETVKHDLRNLL